eukprot:Em0003g1286a
MSEKKNVMKYIVERWYRAEAEKDWKRTIRRKAGDFVVKDSQLYTTGEDGRHWVFDEEDQKRVTEAFHDDLTLRRTNDIKEHVRTCDTCQRTNRKLRKASAELHPIPVRSEVWYQVGIDLVGPLTLIRNNNSKPELSVCASASLIIDISQPKKCSVNEAKKSMIACDEEVKEIKKSRKVACDEEVKEIKKSRKVACDEEVKQIKKSRKVACDEEVKQIKKSRKPGIEQQKTKSEKKAERRKIMKQCRDACNKELEITTPVTLLRENESLSGYARKRLSQYFEIPPSAKRQQKSHAPSFANVKWNKQKKQLLRKKIHDVLRFFTGDHPAQQFERGTQVGGVYKCGGCGRKSTMMADQAHSLRCKTRSLGDIQTLVVQGVLGKVPGALKPLYIPDLPVNDIRKVTVARGIGKNRATLQKELQEILQRVQRVPSLLLLQPDESLTNLNLQYYEVMDCEPLHDIKGHLLNLFQELPSVLPSSVKHKCVNQINMSIKKEKITASDLRSTLVRLFLQVYNTDAD